MKLLALAACEVGLPPNRLDEMVKHVYDAAQLMTVISTREDLDELNRATEEMLALENQWHKPPAQIGDCAVAVRSTLALLGRSVISDRAAGFAGTYLRSSPSPEQWAVWGQLVKHLAFVAMGRLGPADLLAVTNAVPKLMQESISSRIDRPLRRDLRARLRALDIGSGSSEDQFHAYLFSEIAFRVGYEEARKVVDNILGQGWDT
ncbi:MAG TPA: hypothetical protein VFC31_15170 [Candidatus Limnocylindria bacterium]|nr:hypothetical protein [Candidatus Limnocylindria bacterium]